MSTLRIGAAGCLLSLRLLAATNQGATINSGSTETPKSPKREVITVENAEMIVVLGDHPTPAEQRVVELLAERMKDRANVSLAGSKDRGTFRLVLGKATSNERIKYFLETRKEFASLGLDGYIIAADLKNKECFVAGHSDSGVVAGVGRLLREIRYRQGAVEVPALQISEGAQMPNRGMYLWARKDFFGKPDQVNRYIEEFALWGCNGICLWFEMGMFRSFDDPEAQRWLSMYRRFYASARRMGMKTGLLMVANDAYGSSPSELRHAMIIGNHGREHYLCPSKPNSVKQLIAYQEEVFKALEPMDIFNIFPADPGGCSCNACQPWPTCGFWRMAKPLGDRIHELSPKTEIWIDTWHVNHPTFGGKDWKNLVENLDWSKERPGWFAGFEVGLAPKHPYAKMSAEDRNVYNDARQPLMVFPEISMWCNHKGMLVNKEYWKLLQAELGDYSPELMKGGWPYSERWNTDIISVAFLSWFWNPKKTVEMVMDEYASFYFGPEAANLRELLELLDDSNRDQQRKRKISERLAELEAALPEWSKRDWRWAEIVESCRARIQ